MSDLNWSSDEEDLDRWTYDDNDFNEEEYEADGRLVAVERKVNIGTLLENAIYVDNLQEVQNLVENNQICVKTLTLSSGWNSIRYAAFTARYDILYYLIEKSKDDVKNHNEGQPLSENIGDRINSSINNTHQVSTQQQSANAQSGGKKDYINDISETLLLCCNNSVDGEESGVRLKCVQLLLANGANVEFTNRYGITPLMAACKYGYLDIIKELLNHLETEEKKNALISKVDSDKWNVMFFAANHGHEHVASFLLQHFPFLINCKDRRNRTAYNIASTKGLLNVANILKIDDANDANKGEHKKTVGIGWELVARGKFLQQWENKSDDHLQLDDLLTTATSDTNMKKWVKQVFKTSWFTGQRLTLMDQVKQIHMGEWKVESLPIDRNAECNVIDLLEFVATVCRQVRLLRVSILYIGNTMQDADEEVINSMKRMRKKYLLLIRQITSIEQYCNKHAVCSVLQHDHRVRYGSDRSVFITTETITISVLSLVTIAVIIARNPISTFLRSTFHICF